MRLPKRIKDKLDTLAVETTYYLSDLLLLIAVILFACVLVMFVILFLYNLYVWTGFLGLLVIGGGTSFLFLYISGLLHKLAVKKEEK